MSKPEWDHLPNELKSIVIQKLDYTSRCSLRVTSKSHMELVDALPINLNRVMLFINHDSTPPIHLCTAKDIRDQTDDMPLIPLLHNMCHPKSTIQKFMLVSLYMGYEPMFKKLIDKIKEMEVTLKIATFEFVGNPGHGLEKFLELVNVEYCKSLHFEHNRTCGMYFVQNRKMFERFDNLRLKCHWRSLDLWLFNKAYHIRTTPRPIGSCLQLIPTREFSSKSIRRMVEMDDTSRQPKWPDRGFFFYKIDYFGVSFISWVCPVDWKLKNFEEHLLSTILAQPFFDEGAGIGGALSDGNYTLRTTLAREKQKLRLKSFTRRKAPNGRTAKRMFFRRLLSVTL